MSLRVGVCLNGFLLFGLCVCGCVVSVWCVSVLCGVCVCARVFVCVCVCCVCVNVYVGV